MPIVLAMFLLCYADMSSAEPPKPPGGSKATSIINCVSFVPADLGIQERAGHWMIIRSSNKATLLDFGSSMSADAQKNLALAQKVLNIIQLLKLTEQCYIGDSFRHYYLVEYKAPTVPHGEFCQEQGFAYQKLDPNTISTYPAGTGGILVDDKKMILPFAKEQNALFAAAITKNFAFNQLCYDEESPAYNPRFILFLKVGKQ